MGSSVSSVSSVSRASTSYSSQNAICSATMESLVSRALSSSFSGNDSVCVGKPRYDDTPTIGYPDEGPEGATVRVSPSHNVSEWMSAVALCNSDKLIIGDIIEFERDYYSHYGVFVGWENGRAMIIHLANEIRNTYANANTLETHGRAKVMLADLVEEAGVSRCRINNRSMDQEKHYEPSEIVDRAKSKLGPSRFALLTYNCEHFATWCRFGYGYSTQVKAAQETAIEVGKILYDFGKELFAKRSS